MIPAPEAHQRTKTGMGWERACVQLRQLRFALDFIAGR
jgi:hypothetical protein